MLEYELFMDLLHNGHSYRIPHVKHLHTHFFNQVLKMIRKSLLAPVLTMCFVQIISTALITYIFPFVASRKSALWLILMGSLTFDGR
jgi:hypothetical protein